MSTQQLAVIDKRVAVEPSQNYELDNLQQLGGLLAASNYFTDARDMAQAAVKVMAGRELGIPPIASMMGVNIIKGKVALGVHLIASRVRAHGYDFKIKQHDNTGCEIEFFSKADEKGRRSSLGLSSFTEEDAKMAQVFSDMYRKYPRNMYYSRAMSNGAKWYTPEIFGGAPIYTPEELGALVDSEGEMVHSAPVHPVSRQQFVEKRIEEVKAETAQPEPDRPVNDHTPRHDPELVSILSGMRDAATCSDTIGRLKDAIVEITGEDADYYRILALHGFENRQMKGKTAKAAKAAAVDLFNFYKKAQASVAEPVGAIPVAGATWGAEEA